MNRISRRKVLGLGAAAVAAGGALAAGLGLGKKARKARAPDAGAAAPVPSTRRLRSHPPFEAWGRLRSGGREVTLVPTACGACEAGCGSLVTVDAETLAPVKIEGNPLDPSSRGHLCAKGVAALQTLRSPSRVTQPVRRTGSRGAGQWQPVSWDAALSTIADAIAGARTTGKLGEIALAVGGSIAGDPLLEDCFAAVGLTPSGPEPLAGAGAALGARLSWGSPAIASDLSHAGAILCVGSPFEGGPLFTPLASRLVEARARGARVIVIDPKTWPSPTGGDVWLPAAPGSETLILLALAQRLFTTVPSARGYAAGLVNWREALRLESPARTETFDAFVELIKERHGTYSLEFASVEAHVPLRNLQEAVKAIGAADGRLGIVLQPSHASQNLHAFELARAALWLATLAGAIGRQGGIFTGDGWTVPLRAPVAVPPSLSAAAPPAWPLGGDRPQSHLLPHVIRAGEARLRAYIAHGANPVYEYPDGGSWYQLLTSEDQVPLSVALTPTWNETAELADLVLPVGLPEERTSLITRPVGRRRSLSLRQPVVPQAARRLGRAAPLSPNEAGRRDDLAVWLDIAARAGGGAQSRRDVDQVLRDALVRIPQSGAAPIDVGGAGVDLLTLLRERGAIDLGEAVGARATPPRPRRTADRRREASAGADAAADTPGFRTPSQRIEVASTTLKMNRFQDHVLPAYHRSHIHPASVEPGQIALLANLSSATSGRDAPSSWLDEQQLTNPLWVNASDARGIPSGDLCRIRTELGYAVTRVFVTDLVRPGVGILHHGFGRWRHQGDAAGFDAARVGHAGSGLWRRRVRDRGDGSVGGRPGTIRPRDLYTAAGASVSWVIPVQPDPATGSMCWGTPARIERAQPTDRVGDVAVDIERSQEIYLRWVSLARPVETPAAVRARAWLKSANQFVK